jgi:hypothetical protein
MSDTVNSVARRGSKKLLRTFKIPPLSDPRVTMIPEIVERLRCALIKQNHSVDALLANLPEGGSVEVMEAVGLLIEGMNEVLDLSPKIEAAVDFAIDSGWNSGSTQGVSEQNKKNIISRHKNSGKAKEKMMSLWQSGRWLTKTECVEANYESVMREFGLWKENKVEQKPSEKTLLRDLYEYKGESL